MASTNDITHPVTGPGESEARTAVALLLASWLEEHGYTAATVADLATYGREAVVKLTRYDGYAKVTDGRKLAPDYIPSDATWRAAMVVLREKEAHPDPFDGFPS